MVNTKINLSMTEPYVMQIYAKEGDTGRVLEIGLEDYPTENGTLRILRPDGVEVTSEAVTGGEVSESGEVVTFDSLTEADVTELTVGIEPVQDLNGYDAPWVGGAGKNLYNASAINNLSSNGVTATVSNGTITLNGTATANAFFTVLDTGYANKQYTFSLNNPVANSGVRAVFRDANGNYHTDNQVNTVNKVITFTDEPNSISLYVTSGTTLSNFVVKPQLELGYTATAWQPYSNICPIYPFGKNMFDSSIFATDTGTTITFHPYAVPNGTYTMSSEDFPLVADSANVFFASGNVSSTSGISTINNGVYKNRPRTITVTDGYYTVLYRTQSGNTNNPKNYKWQIEQGSTATSYVPYNTLSVYVEPTYDESADPTATVALGQTVYGGTLDVVSGKLTITHKYQLIDGTSGATRLDDNRCSVPIDSNSVTWTDVNHADGKIISDRFENLSNGDSTIKAGILIRANGTHNAVISLRGTGLTVNTTADWTTWLTNNPTQTVYELETPTEVDLTPTQITTLLGTNNIWADGQISELTFDYGKLLSVLTAGQTEVVGRCLGDVNFGGASTMPFTLVVKPNNKENA